MCGVIFLFNTIIIVSLVYIDLYFKLSKIIWYTVFTLIVFNYCRHAKHEVLQNGRQLAFNLIETIQNEYSATYATNNHVAPPTNVPHQSTNVHIQQPQVIHQTIQTNNGQLQQINPGKNIKSM